MESDQSNEIEVIESDEPLLQKSANFGFGSIKYHDMYNMYVTAARQFWTADEVILKQDLVDWTEKLNDNERHFIKRILAFFAASDGIVNENLVERFFQDVQLFEAKLFYAFQIKIESIHAEMYGILIKSLIADPDERNFLFDAINTIPCVKKKADWALKWISNQDATFGERLIAFAAVEGKLQQKLLK